MLILVKLIGVYIAVMGILFILNPKTLRRYIAFWEQGKRLYVVGVSRLLMGLILLFTAPQCRFRWVVIILGIFTLISAVPYFVMRKEKMIAMISRWDKRPVGFIRLLGSIALVMGVLLIYSA